MWIEEVSRALLYERGNTFLHRLDPRVKLAYIAVSALMMFLTENPVSLLALLVLHVLLAGLGGLASKVLSLLKGLALFIITIMALNTVLTYFFSFIDPLSLALAFYGMVVRAVVVLAMFTIFVSTTSPHELTQALMRLGLSRGYAYSMVVAFRFIPIIFAEMRDIYDAQRSRGLELEKGSPLGRIRKLAPIIIPSIVCALLRSKDIAESMESRAFGACEKRTFYRPIRVRVLDAVFITAVLLLQVLCVYPDIVFRIAGVG